MLRLRIVRERITWEKLQFKNGSIQIGDQFVTVASRASTEAGKTKALPAIRGQGSVLAPLLPSSLAPLLPALHHSVLPLREQALLVDGSEPNQAIDGVGGRPLARVVMAHLQLAQQSKRE